MSQAVIRFLATQHVERDGESHPFFGGVLGIFGHGNLAGVGQALLQYRDERLRYYQVRNEQGMVHMATAFAKTSNRLSAMACSTSIGPGATNMITGAATATVNRLPVLLLPGDIFATRRAGSVLQQLEAGWSQDVSVNDAFKPVSRYWDRINRPEQLPAALLEAMRILTSPSETGAVTLCLPQDVQAEAWDFPAELFEPRTWHVPRNRPDASAVERACRAIRAARRPLIIAGGGTIYSGASTALADFVETTGIPVGETQAGKGSLSYDHPLNFSAFGVSGSAHVNRLANEADVVIGIGTRYTDFTTASQTLFSHDATFVNLNVGEFDSHKQSAIAVTGDARAGLEALSEALGSFEVEPTYRRQAEAGTALWRDEVDALVAPSGDGLPAQAEVVGLVNASSGPRDVVVCAAGSLPGDLHRLWKARDPQAYHMEYGFSCMGYEVAGAVGAKMADPSREVYSVVGDGSWLMMSQEILTAVQENLKIVVVLIDNHGFGSIAALSEASGSQGFGTRFRSRGEDGQLSGATLAIDFVANAKSLGADVLRASSAGQLKDALVEARASDRTTVVYVEVDPQGRFGGSGAWWDVPIAEVATETSTRNARVAYEAASLNRKSYLKPTSEPVVGAASAAT